MKKTLLIIATLDTKGKEAVYLQNCVKIRGVKPFLMDIGILGQPGIVPDIGSHEVAQAGGRDLDQFIAGNDRSGAVAAVQEGGVILARKLVAEGKIDGVLGLGGGTGTAMVTSIMRALPFGFPKVVVSTVASRDVRPYVGTKDIVMFHSVADILGLNEFLRLILGQAAYAVCGMIDRGSVLERKNLMVAVTAYGVSSQCALNAEPMLKKKHYEMIGFHANGVGGMAMEQMIAEGFISGVLDFTLHEIADEMFGGYCRGIELTRLETAGRMGVPLVVAPGGLDNAVFSPHYPMPDILKGRRQHAHDERFCVRMERDEMIAFARIVGGKLNKYEHPAYVLIPKKGWSEADKQGMSLYDPAVNQVFTEELKRITGNHVTIEEIDAHISEVPFAERAVHVLCGLLEAKGGHGLSCPADGPDA